MNPTSISTMFDLELTGVVVENEQKTIDPTAPGRSTVDKSTIYQGLARVVDLSNKEVTVDVHDKQKKERFCLYLDRSFVGVVREGMKVKFRADQIGWNVDYSEVSANTHNLVKGVIVREVRPQATSLIGKLELYINTTN